MGFWKEGKAVFMSKKEKSVLRALAMISQISISMLVPIFLCAAIGWWLNERFGKPLWFVAMVVIGIGAAFRNAYILTLSFYSEDMRKEHDRLQYIQDLKDYSKNHPQDRD